MLRASYLNYFAPLRFHSFQQLKAHRLPLFGSPAGRCGLRLNCFICLRFALAIKAVALCSSVPQSFLYDLFLMVKNFVPLPTYAAKGYRILKPFLCTTLAPLAGGSRSLVSVRNPFRYRSIHCSHSPTVWLKAVFSCVVFFRLTV